jgi:hypothetical protein
MPLARTIDPSLDRRPLLLRSYGWPTVSRSRSSTFAVAS